MKTRLRRGRYYALRLYRFLRLDMWRLTPEETPHILRLFVGVIKVIYQTVLSGIERDLVGKASALTYSTALSIVPILAIIVGIAKGFGLQTIVHNALMEALPGQQEQLAQIFVYVDNYLNQVQGGLFIGLGLAILLYTVIILIAGIEDAFNDIWQAPHGRPWGRRILDYLGLFILLPLVITVSSMITLASSAISNSVLAELPFFHTIFSSTLQLLPLFISILIYVGLYMFLPNVRVRFLPALISGILAGITYQIFQMLYIGGLIWISRYNAIYGSFAILPLMLLWIQFSWTITLFGAQLSYSIQNLSRYTFGTAVDKSSRRYQDFVAILILQRMLQRFEQVQQRPYSIEEMSRECCIPLRMAGIVFARLEEAGLIIEVRWAEDEETGYYQPAQSPTELSIGHVVDRLDGHGTEDFRIDRYGRYHRAWQALLTSRGHSVEGIDRSTLISEL